MNYLKIITIDMLVMTAYIIGYFQGKHVARLEQELIENMKKETTNEEPNEHGENMPGGW